MWTFLQWQGQLLNEFHSVFLKGIISYILRHYRFFQYLWSHGQCMRGTVDPTVRETKRIALESD